MSKRLQVVMDEAEYEELQRVARRHRMTVSEWVRQALRDSRASEPRYDSERKLLAVREAARHSYPTADIDQMLEEIADAHAGEEP